MKRNLLFISRYPEIIDEFQGILEEKQIETEIAQNGTDAMELLKQKEYQILVTDLNLDGYNGDKILSYVNQKFPDTIFMLYTNSISAVQLGFYLNKRDVFRVFLRPVNFRQEFMQALEEAYELYDLKKHDRDSRQERLKQLEGNRKDRQKNRLKLRGKRQKKRQDRNLRNYMRRHIMRMAIFLLMYRRTGLDIGQEKNQTTQPMALCVRHINLSMIRRRKIMAGWEKYM